MKDPTELRHAVMRYGARVAELGGDRAEFAETLRAAPPEETRAALAAFDAVRAQMAPGCAQPTSEAARLAFAAACAAQKTS